MLKWNYPWEKLYSAFYSACRGAIGSADRPQERLRSVAWEVSVLVHGNHVTDDGLRKKMEKFIAACTSKPSHHGERTLPATTSQMTDDEAGELLREAFDFFTKVAELKALESQRLR